MSYSDILITLVIVGLVLLAARRSGQSNPIGTGALARRLVTLEATVNSQGAQINAVESTLREVVTSSNETTKSVQSIRIEIAGDRGLAERTWAAIDRIQDYFIKDGFDRRTGQ